MKFLKYKKLIFIIFFLTAIFIAFVCVKNFVLAQYGVIEVPLGSQQVTDISSWIRSIFLFALGFVGIVALFAIVFGGFQYLVSGGSEARKKEGKDWITGAVFGVLLLLGSVLILRTLGSQFISLQLPNISQLGSGMPISSPLVGGAYQLEVPLGGQVSVGDLSSWVRMVFVFGLGFVGIVALFAIVFGGFQYLVSGGSEARKSEGKQWIWNAASGVLLLLASVLILRTINPQLTSLVAPTLASIEIPPHSGLGANIPITDTPNTYYPTPAAVGEARKDVAQWTDLAQKWGAERGVPPSLILAMIEQESGGDPNATSPDKGRGLMQITSPGLYTKYGLDDPYSPSENVRVGTSYLRDLYDYYGNWEQAIAAYNSGQGNVNKAIAQGGENWVQYLPQGTNSYGVKYDVPAYYYSVMNRWDAWQSRLGG